MDETIYAIHVLKFGDDGAELVQSWSKSGFFRDPDDEKFFAVKQGSILLTIQRFSMGLSGPFPVSDFPNVKSMVYAFQLEDQSLQDKRHKNMAYTIIIIYFPIIIEQDIISRRSELEHALLKLTIGKHNITEIDAEFLELLKAEVHDVITQMDQVILLANMELVLNKKKGIKWSIYATGGANYQEITKQIYLMLFDKIDRYERETTGGGGLTTSSTINAFDDRMNIEITVLSNYNAIETINQACTSDSWKTGDIIFFILPFSYSPENETTSILNVLDHCDDQTPLIVISEKVEEMEGTIDMVTDVSCGSSLSVLKKQLIKKTQAPLLVLSGTVDQKIILKAIRYSDQALA